MSPQVNTPFVNPSDDIQEIEVTDPMHALYGRRFRVLSICMLPGAAGYVDVHYKAPMRLRIGLDSTQLRLSHNYLGTKLTLESVTELVTFLQQCEVPCLSPPLKSGVTCPQTFKPPSFKTY
ncbi:hypothetical protein ACSYAD_31885 [Acaryochloris marina NIES-2412]|uniref:hypothetical protein n=1 Tax=Acaryochloris marina TaxID=155978 RepID=UPI004058358C